MSNITQITTAVTGNTITAAVWNEEWSNIIDDYNGSISNANIAADAAIAISKLATINESSVVFATGGHGHTGGTDGKVITVNRSFTWGISGNVTTGNEQGMKYISPQALTVTNLRAKTDSGTATIRIQQGTTSIDASASVTSTAGNITSFDSTAIAAGVVVTLDVTAVSSCSGLYVVMECTQ